jgi:RimJ/RimL family protein N-acetyltransferase
MSVAFRPMTAEDLPVLHEWLQREHVRRWWTRRETLDDVREHYLAAIEGRDPTDLYFILLDGAPSGFIQTYQVSDHPEYQELVGVEDGVAGVDLFLADEERLGRGVGTRVLQEFLRQIVFAVPTTRACVADPDTENGSSLRAFEKAGFSAVRELVDPDDARAHVLMRIDR